MKKYDCDAEKNRPVYRMGTQSSIEIDPVLQLTEVLKVTSLKKTALYKMIEEGSFPRQIKLTKRRVGWKKSAIIDWIDSRPYVDKIV